MATQWAVPDEGLGEALDTLVKLALTSDQPLQLRLAVNDLVPQRTTVLADYTEATFAGYSRRTLNRADWQLAFVEENHEARTILAAGPQLFNPTETGETVYVVLIVDPGIEVVRYQKRLATPREVIDGVPFAVNPVITLESKGYEV